MDVLLYRYKQYTLSHTKKITSLCCHEDPSHFRFRPYGFVVVVVHHPVELCEARNDRDWDMCLQKALKFQLHRCHINLRRKNYFRRMNSALRTIRTLTYRSSRYSDNQVA